MSSIDCSIESSVISKPSERAALIALRIQLVGAGRWLGTVSVESTYFPHFSSPSFPFAIDSGCTADVGIYSWQRKMSVGAQVV